jgi:hypothetical protein
MRTATNHARSAKQMSRADDVVAKAAYVAQAKRQYDLQSNNDIEIDEEPVVSVAEEGAWIAAWVWVNRKEAGLGKRTRIRVAKIKRLPAKSQD